MEQVGGTLFFKKSALYQSQLILATANTAKIAESASINFRHV
jgi:hypothetical protein